MAGGNAQNSRGTSLLSWAQFGWMVVSALVGATVTGTGAYYGLQEQMRAEFRAEMTAREQRLRDEFLLRLSAYTPITELSRWKEEFQAQQNRMGRQVDRIEARVVR